MNLCPGKSSGSPQTPQKRMNRVQEIFARIPKKAATQVSLKLQVLQLTVWHILRQGLHFKPYKL